MINQKTNDFTFDDSGKLVSVCGVELLPFELLYWTRIAEVVKEAEHEASLPDAVKDAREIAENVPMSGVPVEYELADGTKQTVKVKMGEGSPFLRETRDLRLPTPKFNILAIHVLQYRIQYLSQQTSSLKRAAEELMWIENFTDADFPIEQLHADLSKYGKLAAETYVELRAAMKKNNWEWYEEIPPQETYNEIPIGRRAVASAPMGLIQSIRPRR